MLSAVHVIHNVGIIHTDLKPANFLFVGPTLKLIDFGIANKIQVLKAIKIYILCCFLQKSVDSLLTQVFDKL